MSIIEATAKLVRGALENIGDDLIREALDHEGIQPTNSKTNQVGRLIDELDEYTALTEAGGRLLEAEERESNAQHIRDQEAQQ